MIDVVRSKVLHICQGSVKGLQGTNFARKSGTLCNEERWSQPDATQKCYTTAALIYSK